jgi:hypothetical protein
MTDHGWTRHGHRCCDQATGPRPQSVARCELVLTAFVGSRPSGLEGCHRNGDPTDNRLENLRWDTRTANIFDAVAHGTHPFASRTQCPRGHLLVEPNLVRSILPNRGCLACNRARARVAWLKTRGTVADHREWADRYYADIVTEASAP